MESDSMCNLSDTGNGFPRVVESPARVHEQAGNQKNSLTEAQRTQRKGRELGSAQVREL